MDYIVNQTFAEIKINDSAKLCRTLSQKDIELFAAISGDINPAHIDIEYAKHDIFHKLIAHGMWGAMLFSTLLGTKLPGPGTIYLDQTLQFLHPIVIGDTVTATVTVVEKISEKNKIKLECRCINQLNEKLIKGIATVIAPNEKIKRPRIVLPEVEFKRSSS